MPVSEICPSCNGRVYPWKKRKHKCHPLWRASLLGVSDSEAEIYARDIHAAAQMRVELEHKCSGSEPPSSRDDLGEYYVHVVKAGKQAMAMNGNVGWFKVTPTWTVIHRVDSINGADLPKDGSDEGV